MSEPKQRRFRWRRLGALSDDVTLDVKESDILQATYTAPTATSETAQLDAYARGLQEAKKFKAEQENALRDKFFLLAVWLSWAIIGTSIIGIGAYMWFKKADMAESVIITWITAVVVEIIAILKIMAKYLFPPADIKSEDP